MRAGATTLPLQRPQRGAVDEQDREQREVGEVPHDRAVRIDLDQAEAALADQGPREQEHQGGGEHRPRRDPGHEDRDEQADGEQQDQRHRSLPARPTGPVFSGSAADRRGRGPATCRCEHPQVRSKARDPRASADTRQAAHLTADSGGDGD